MPRIVKFKTSNSKDAIEYTVTFGKPNEQYCQVEWITTGPGIRHPDEATYLKSEIDYYINSLSWIVLSDTDRETAFQFTLNPKLSSSIYTATPVSDRFDISWEGEDFKSALNYSSKIVKDNLANGSWVLYQEPVKCNGVDGEGNPLEFSENLLKPFMRAVTRNGNEYLVAKLNDKVFIVREEGWCSLRIGEMSSEFGYDIISIYNPPTCYINILKLSVRGELVWKSNT